MTGYLDKAIRQLVLIMPKMSRYIKKIKVRNEDKGKTNKLLSFCLDDEKLLEKYKATWIKIEDLQNINLNALPMIIDGLNVPGVYVECESLIVISVDSLLD